MQALNLPPYNIRFTEKEGKKYIYDPLRRKNVAFTPEEWVRQHFVNFLITDKGYPKGRIANEVSINLNNTLKRCDTIVYDDFLDPLAIIEYKAPEVNISEKVFEQIIQYNSAMHVPYLIVSNGLFHYCCHISYETLDYQFLKDIPMYVETIQKRRK